MKGITKLCNFFADIETFIIADLPNFKLILFEPSKLKRFK